MLPVSSTMNMQLLKLKRKGGFKTLLQKKKIVAFVVAFLVCMHGLAHVPPLTSYFSSFFPSSFLPVALLYSWMHILNGCFVFVFSFLFGHCLVVGDSMSVGL